MTYGWHTSTYEWHADECEYIWVTYGWHTSTYQWHTDAIGVHTSDIRITYVPKEKKLTFLKLLDNSSKYPICKRTPCMQ